MFLFTWSGLFLPGFHVPHLLDTSDELPFVEWVDFLTVSSRYQPYSNAEALKDHSAVCGTKLRERSRRQLFGPDIHSAFDISFFCRTRKGRPARISEWRENESIQEGAEAASGD